jgi:hypothetical protein
MEKLVLTSKILYDITICEKMDEIHKLKCKYEIPKIIYEDYEEWENLKIEAMRICKEGMSEFKWDGEDPFRYEPDIYPGQLVEEGLYLLLIAAFNKISKGQSNEWVRNYAQIINSTIKNTIRILFDMGQWERMFHELGHNGLNTFILKIIMGFFDEQSYFEYFPHQDSICVIRYFKCSCGEMLDWGECGTCWDCWEMKDKKRTVK